MKTILPIRRFDYSLLYLSENYILLSAFNLYRCVGVSVLDFRIVEFLPPMHPLCFLDKLRCRFAYVPKLNKGLK